MQVGRVGALVKRLERGALVADAEGGAVTGEANGIVGPLEDDVAQGGHGQSKVVGRPGFPRPALKNRIADNDPLVRQHQADHTRRVAGRMDNPQGMLADRDRIPVGQPDIGAEAHRRIAGMHRDRHVEPGFHLVQSLDVVVMAMRHHDAHGRRVGQQGQQRLRLRAGIYQQALLRFRADNRVSIHRIRANWGRFQNQRQGHRLTPYIVLRVASSVIR